MVPFIASTDSIFYMYECVIHNSKLRKCCRFRIYKLAEDWGARIRSSKSDDGIFYPENSPSVSVRLLFPQMTNADHFQSAIRDLPGHYRKRPNLSSACEIAINNDSVSMVVCKEEELRRIFKSDYCRVDGDENPSAECDGESVVASSYVSAVFVDDSVKLRLLDAEDSLTLLGAKPEKCHLKSQSKYPAFKTNPNNILFMSRLLHEHFDGINCLDGVPSFYVVYKNHSTQSMIKEVNGKKECVFETTVHVVFRTERLKQVAEFIRDSVNVNQTTIEIRLFFENPDEFKDFAAHKMEETLSRWASLRGPEEDADDE